MHDNMIYGNESMLKVQKCNKNSQPLLWWINCKETIFCVYIFINHQAVCTYRLKQMK